MTWLILFIFMFAALIYVISQNVKLRDGQDILIQKARTDAYATEAERHKYWREVELAEVCRQATAAARLEFDRWKTEHTVAERADAVKKSRAVNNGLVSEQFAPFLRGWPYKVKDCHFSGQPIDYLVFDGLDAGELKQIVLVDVKTGQSQLNAREKQVRDAVAFGRVKFEVFRPDALGEAN